MVLAAMAIKVVGEHKLVLSMLHFTLKSKKVSSFSCDLKKIYYHITPRLHVHLISTTKTYTITVAYQSTGVRIAQLVQRLTEKPGTILTHVQVPGAARDFSPRVGFYSRLCYGVHTAPVCGHMHHSTQPHHCLDTRTYCTHP